MSKKYKTWEVIKMLSENTKLEFIKRDKIGFFTVGSSKDGFIEVKDTAWYSDELYNNLCINDTWELIGNAVSMKEALQSDKLCRVEHKLIPLNDDCKCDELLLVDKWNNFCNGDYLYPSDIMMLLGWKLSPLDFNKVIKEGQWYIEN